MDTSNLFYVINENNVIMTLNKEYISDYETIHSFYNDTDGDGCTIHRPFYVPSMCEKDCQILNEFSQFKRKKENENMDTKIEWLKTMNTPTETLIKIGEYYNVKDLLNLVRDVFLHYVRNKDTEMLERIFAIKENTTCSEKQCILSMKNFIHFPQIFR